MSAWFTSPAGLAVAVPLAAALGLWFVRRAALAGWLGLAAAATTLAACAALPWHEGADALLRVDGLAMHMAIVTALGGLLAAWLGRARMAGADGAAFHAVLAALVLAVLSNNLLLTAAAVEAALLVLLLHGNPTARRGLLAGVAGLAMVLFGSMVMYHAGLAALAPGLAPMSWDALADAAPALPPGLLSLGFAFLLAGYATCAGLAPMHGWPMQGWPMQGWHRAAMHQAGPAALLLPALTGVSMLALLRGREIVMGHGDAVDAGPPLLILGLLSVLTAAFLLRRARAGRLAALAVLLHAGLAAFAFGLGGASAIAAGLALLSVAVLLPPLVAHGTARPAAYRTAAAALAVLALLPPFAPFGSAVTLLAETLRQTPWLFLPLGLALAGAVAALVAQTARLLSAPAGRAPGRLQSILAAAPAALVLALALAAGMSPAAAAWLGLLAEGLR